ncbi:hypothetical protein ACWDTP_17275 [Mycobacterium sp. NPDC003449]
MVDLSVDADGLNAAAADSEAVASGIVSGTSGVSGVHPSQTGVAAFDAALSALRSGQSSRMTDQAGQLSTSSGVYTETDDGAAGTISL